MTKAFQAEFLDTAAIALAECKAKAETGALGRFEALRQRLTPAQVAATDDAMRRLHAFQYYRSERLAHALARRFDSRFFSATPRAAFLFAQSHDGYVRETAVRTMPLDRGDPAALTLLLLRCNDWVAEVRAAAFGRLYATLPGATATDLQPLCLFVFERSQTWGRGGAEAARRVMAHSHWSTALLATLMTEVNGPLARVLRQLLCTPALDAALPSLAADARSAFVRSVAAQALLEGCARWPVGTEWRWIDKTVAKRQRHVVFHSRPIETGDLDLTDIAEAAARDKSANVRKHAADYLIAHGSSGLTAVARALRADRSRAVAERMAYFDRKWSGLDAPPEGDRA